MSTNVFVTLWSLRAPLMESVDLSASSVGDARTGLSVLLTLMAAVPAIALIVLVFFIYRRIAGRRRRTTLEEDYRKEAGEHERAGRFVSAAGIYRHHLKDDRRAAELYEEGGDYRQAALMYDLLGEQARAGEMYKKAGDSESAATVSVLAGDYEEAARIYYDSGRKIDAAAMLEKAGRRMAAIPVYREAGEYRKAAELMEEEGMLREAAEMFGISLREKKVSDCIDDFYAYALKLERAGDKRMSLEVFRAIEHEDRNYRDVRERLETLAPEPHEEDPGSRTTLRSFIRSGKIEPKYALKLWVHILRALQEAYANGRPFGGLNPDSIAIDVNNNVSFLMKPADSVYASPEIVRGAEPDACSDVYSAGIILYEMLAGSLEGLGLERISKTVEDVPEWLDEIVVNCLRKVREDRYQNIEMIFSDIKTLSAKKKGE